MMRGRDHSSLAQCPHGSPSVISFEESVTMPRSIGPLLVLLALAATAFSCSSPRDQAKHENVPSGASGSAMQSGAAGAFQGGQPGQGGATTGGVAAGGAATGGVAAGGT